MRSLVLGVGGLMFGGDGSSSREDSYVERYLDRINNGALAEDRRAAMSDLQALVAESYSAQLAFGALGFPILLAVLKEERDDVEMIRGALETLLSALTPIDTAQRLNNTVQPASMNSDLLSRESESISTILSLLSEDDFYVRYYTLQLLTSLTTHSPNRLQEAILSIPRGITKLVDMLLDREVIRNETLLLLMHFTRDAQEIQKILVFEGVFEKIFSIIKEEGVSDGGVVVQDCLELLNNLIRNNASNQILLKETVGFDPIVAILKLRRGSAFNFTQQKTINLLKALETVELLLLGGKEGEPGGEANKFSNQTVLAQNKILDHLLLLGVESQWASVSVRCLALRCIGNMIAGNRTNLDSFANKLVGEEHFVEPALNALFRILLRTTAMQEFLAADYVFKSFCENNPDGQKMLASTMTAQPQFAEKATTLDDRSMPFGSLLLHAFVSGGAHRDLETCCRAASVLFSILKDNDSVKDQVVQISFEAPVPSFGSLEPLMHHIIRCLSFSESTQSKDNHQRNPNKDNRTYIQPIILRLLVAWMADCPKAVNCFLASAAHLTFVLELASSTSASACVRGLAALLLGEFVIYNNSGDNNNVQDTFCLIDTICKNGLNSYLVTLDELEKFFTALSPVMIRRHKLSVRSVTASMLDMEEAEDDDMDQRHENVVFAMVFDQQFVALCRRLEANIRNNMVEVFGQTKNKVAVVPAEMERKDGELGEEYIKRLKTFLERQCIDMQDLISRNSALAEELAKGGRSCVASLADQTSRNLGEAEAFRRSLEEATQRIGVLESDRATAEAEKAHYCNLAGKVESDLKSLSDAYNSLEQDNFRLETELKVCRNKAGKTQYPDVESVRAEAREEAQKESEAELNDLLVCLGQEQSKVEKLSSRLLELGEDVDKLLEGIGVDAGLGNEVDEDED